MNHHDQIFSTDHDGFMFALSSEIKKCIIKFFLDSCTKISDNLTYCKHDYCDNMKVTCVGWSCVSQNLWYYQHHEAIMVRIKTLATTNQLQHVSHSQFMVLVLLFCSHLLHTHPSESRMGPLPFLLPLLQKILQLIFVMAKNLQIAPCLFGRNQRPASQAWATCIFPKNQ